MAAQPDKPVDDDGWELAGSFRMARTLCGWVMTGGEDDDDEVTLDFVVFHPDDDELVKRYRVRMPLEVDANGLSAYQPTVERA